MAKSSYWLFGARGKMAGVILQGTGDGGYMMREQVKPRDPQTEQQLVQRALLATVLLAYKQLKAVCALAFEGLTTGRETMSVFMKLNLNLLRQKARADLEAGVAVGKTGGTTTAWDTGTGGATAAQGAYTPRGTRWLVGNEYVVSLGTLPRVRVTLPGDAPWTAAMSGVEGNSYQAVLDAYGLCRGDRLTFVAIGGETVERQGAAVATVVLDPRYADGSQAPLTVPFTRDDGRVNLPSPLNDDRRLRLHAAADGVRFWFVTYGTDGGDDVTALRMTAGGVVVSRYSGRRWLHSMCQLVTSRPHAARPTGKNKEKRENVLSFPHLFVPLHQDRNNLKINTTLYGKNMEMVWEEGPYHPCPTETDRRRRHCHGAARRAPGAGLDP